MTLAIRGIGAVGGFGCGIDALDTALAGNERKVQRVSVKTPEGIIEMPAYRADTSRLEDYVTKRVLRRVDHYSRMALLGAYLALDDAKKLDEDRSRMGIVIATGYGASHTTFAFLDSFIHDGDNLSSPTHFSNSVHNAAVANVSMLLNITGPGLTVSQFEMSVPSAMLAARIWLEEGRVDSVLFGAVDEYCDVLGYCWSRFFGDSATAAHRIRPLEFGLQTAIPGEGAAFFLLTREGDYPPEYAFIKDIHFGRIEPVPPATPKTADAILFLGADGHKGFGDHYGQYLSKAAGVACYTPLYGSLPIGTAFDIAVASLSIKNKKVFLNNETPSTGNAYYGQPLDDSQITCVKISNSGDLGLIGLSGRQ